MRAGKPRILLITSDRSVGLQYHTRNMCEALEAEGFDGWVIYDGQSAWKSAERLKDLDYSAVFVCDVMRGNFPPIFDGRPILTWVLNWHDHLADSRAVARLGPNDRIYYMHSGKLPWLLNAGYPPNQLEKLLPAVPESYFREVSGGAGMPCGVFANVKQPDGTDMHGMMHLEKIERLCRAGRSAGTEDCFEVYGRGWADVPVTREFLPYWKGVLTHGPELADHMNKVACVLQTGMTNVHFRTLEAYAAGTVPVLEPILEKPDNMNPNQREATIYDLFHQDMPMARATPHDMTSVISLLRSNEEKRRKLALAGQEAVRERHTYRHRARQILRYLQEEKLL